MKAKLQPSTAKIVLELDIMESQIIADACLKAGNDADITSHAFRVMMQANHRLHVLIEDSQKTQ